MTRTAAREIAVHLSYALGFAVGRADAYLADFLTPDNFAHLAAEDALYAEFPDETQRSYITRLVCGADTHSAELDGYIGKYAKGRRFSRIDRVASAIMRIAMFEMMYMPEIPNAAAINEAVEIAKGYEEPELAAFINGVLGTFVRTELEGETP